MQIFLIGFMGAGKSSLGKKIASRLSVNFIDADRAIEKEQNRSVQQIFSEEGEEKFRAIETDWLKNLKEGNDVIALGGGTPCFNNNLSLIQQKGISIYIKTPVPVIVSRLKQAKEVRPIIEHVKKDHEALTALVADMLAQRESFYNQANIIFDGADVTSQSLDELERQIGSYLL
ncbi:MAG: shikimate kinase [Crocinitomicaceae bacterium]|nr:shikimate kinase [Crocinitomicaceae bacterium]